MTELWTRTDIAAFLAYSTSMDSNPVSGTRDFSFLRRLVYSASLNIPDPPQSTRRGPDPVVYHPQQVIAVIQQLADTRVRQPFAKPVVDRIFSVDNALAELTAPFLEDRSDSLLPQVRQYYSQKLA